jgi:hypothetical protein
MVLRDNFPKGNLKWPTGLLLGPWEVASRQKSGRSGVHCL